MESDWFLISEFRSTCSGMLMSFDLKVVNLISMLSSSHICNTIISLLVF